MKQATGFLTNDGKFFETDREAEFHEAEQELQELARVQGIDPHRLMEAVWDLRIPIRRYIDAKDANTVNQPFDESSLDAPYTSGPYTSGLDRRDTASTQKLPANLLDE